MKPSRVELLGFILFWIIGQVIEQGVRFVLASSPLLIASFVMWNLIGRQNLSFALLTYRFGSSPYHTSLYTLKLRVGDYCFVTLCLVLTIALVCWQEALR